MLTLEQIKTMSAIEIIQSPVGERQGTFQEYKVITSIVQKYLAQISKEQLSQLKRKLLWEKEKQFFQCLIRKEFINRQFDDWNQKMKDPKFKLEFQKRQLKEKQRKFEEYKKKFENQRQKFEQQKEQFLELKSIASSSTSYETRRQQEKEYLCSLTMQLMAEPVDGPCGHTFEKANIQNKLKMKEECPLQTCGKPLKLCELSQNAFMKRQIQRFKKKQQKTRVKEKGKWM